MLCPTQSHVASRTSGHWQGCRHTPVSRHVSSTPLHPGHVPRHSQDPPMTPCTHTEPSRAGLTPSSWEPWSLPPPCPPHLGLLPSPSLSGFQAPAHPLAGHLLSSGPGEEWAGSPVCQGSCAVASRSGWTRMQKHALLMRKIKEEEVSAAGSLPRSHSSYRFPCPPPPGPSPWAGAEEPPHAGRRFFGASMLRAPCDAHPCWFLGGGRHQAGLPQKVGKTVPSWLGQQVRLKYRFPGPRSEV